MNKATTATVRNLAMRWGHALKKSITMESMVRYPHGNTFYRKLDHDFPVIDRAEGIHLYDSEGKQYIDGCAGAAVVSLGHGNREVLQAMSEQAAKLSYANALHFSSETVDRYTAALAKVLPESLDKISIMSSGSEAIEAACKLVMQYWQIKGAASKEHFIAFEPSYHGNTLLALSLSGRPHYKKAFSSYLCDKVHHVEAPYRLGFKDDYDTDGADYYLAKIQQKVQELGSENIAAVFFEPVSGASLGGNILPKGFAKKLRDYCSQQDILLVADEVMCGAGRVGSFCAVEQSEICPDLLVMGKGLGSGYAPLSALATSTDIVDSLKNSGQNFMHAQTFMFHPVAAAVGLAVLKVIQDNDLLAAVRERGQELEAFLQEAFTDYSRVHVTKASGLLRSVEILDADSADLAQKIASAAMAKGLVVWPSSGHGDNGLGNLLLLAPPFVSQSEDLREMVVRLRSAIEDIL